jgi:nucleotide-binding universal stress UspA family protein
MTRILVAYDGSPHATDALTLGRQLGGVAGVSIELAYVHHTIPAQPGGELSHAERERFLTHHAERLLSEAAELIGDPGARRHVVDSTTTATGLRELAEREQIDLIVFGSAVGTTPGRVHPGSASRRLLQNGPAALAFAPAGYRALEEGDLSAVAVVEDDQSASAQRTAQGIAELISGRLVEPADADLIVLGSRPGAIDGRVQVGPAVERAIRSATAPILVVPHAVALELGGALAAA